MKILKLVLVSVLIAGGAFSISSCGGSSSKEKVEQSGPEYTSKYVCPMHCKGSGSEEAGTCPVCGMDYVLNEEHTEDGHEHNGHSHDDHEGHNH